MCYSCPNPRRKYSIHKLIDRNHKNLIFAIYCVDNFLLEPFYRKYQGVEVSNKETKNT